MAFATNIIPGQSGTYRHLLVRVTDLLADSGQRHSGEHVIRKQRSGYVAIRCGAFAIISVGRELIVAAESARDVLTDLMRARRPLIHNAWFFCAKHWGVGVFMIRTMRLTLIAIAIVAFGLVLSVPASAAAATASGPAVSATTVTPQSAVGCSGDACIYLGDPSGGKVLVSGCAWKTTFYGHIQITGPNGLSRNSATQTWHSTSHYCTGSDQRYSQTVPAVVGQYCAVAWEASGTRYGRACENVE